MPNLSDVNSLKAKDLWPVSIGFVLALFSHRQLPRFRFTGHWPLATLLPLPATIPSHSPCQSKHTPRAALPPGRREDLLLTPNCQRPSARSPHTEFTTESPDSCECLRKSEMETSLESGRGKGTLLTMTAVLDEATGTVISLGKTGNLCNLLICPAWERSSKA